MQTESKSLFRNEKKVELVSSYTLQRSKLALVILAVIALVFCTLPVASTVSAEPATSEESTAADGTSKSEEDGLDAAENSDDSEPENADQDENLAEESEGVEDELAADLADSLSSPSFYFGQSRASGFAPGKDPRYYCGLSIGLLFDTSETTAEHKLEFKEATKNVVETLNGTGSSLGIHTFAATSPTNPAIGNFAPRLIEGEGYQEALEYVEKLPNAWDNLNVRTNYAAAFQGVQGAGYDVVILVSDGIPYFSNRTKDINNEIRVTTEDIENSLAEIEKVKAEGTQVMTIYAEASDRNTTARYLTLANSDPIDRRTAYATRFFGDQPFIGTQDPDTRFIEWYWEAGPSAAGANRIRYMFNGNIVINTSSAPQTRVVDGVLQTYARNAWRTAIVQWQFNPEKFTRFFSDYQENVYDFSGVRQTLESLIVGCNGTLTIQKQMVDAGGAETGELAEGFEFVANEAMDEDRVVSDGSETTSASGDVQFRYAVSTGASSITITEDPERDGQVYTMYEQTVGTNQKSVARCTATDSKNNPLTVSYGSGSGIVVHSDAENNQFRVTGLGRDDRVTCVVQNAPLSASFELSKDANAEEKLFITGANGQVLSARYELAITNTADSAGAPTQILEQPRIPRGTTVASVVAQPTDGGNQLIESEVEFKAASSGLAWTLDAADANFKDIQPGEEAKLYVLVTYRVTNAGNLTGTSLTCSGTTASRGFFNRATVFPGADASNPTQGSWDTACLNAGRAGVSLKKYANNEDAQTPDTAVALAPNTESYQVRITVRNNGQVPLEQVQLTEYQLSNENPTSRVGAVNYSGMRCGAGTQVSGSGSTYSIEFDSGSFAPGAEVTCEYTAQGAMLPDLADFYGGEAEVEATPVVPEYQYEKSSSTLTALKASDPAWVLRMPAAIGVLPMTGGKGVWYQLGIGFLLLVAGAFGLRKKTTT